MRPEPSGATCSSKPRSRRFHQLAFGSKLGNEATLARTGSHATAGYISTQPSGCAVSTSDFPAASRPARCRVGIATRPLASSVMTADPRNEESLWLFLPLFSTFFHLSEKRSEGQGGFPRPERDL